VPEFKTNEYWVYLTQGTKFFVVKAPNAIPVHVSFADCKLPPAQSRMTYELVLSRVGQVSLSSLAYNQDVLNKVAEGKQLYDKKDYTNAYQCLHLPAELGNSEAQYYIGECRYNGRGVPQDVTEAIKWYLKSAEQGYAIAQCNLAHFYYSGEKIPRDYAKAVNLYSKSANQGYAVAQNNLGSCYEHGYGVAQEYAEAFKWYSRSADQNYVYAHTAVPLKSADFKIID